MVLSAISRFSSHGWRPSKTSRNSHAWKCSTGFTSPGATCLDGTPLIDIKPDRTLFSPIAPPQPGDFQTS